MTNQPVWSVVEEGWLLAFLCVCCVGLGLPWQRTVPLPLSPAHVCWQGFVVPGGGVFVWLVYRRGGHRAVTACKHTAACEPASLVVMVAGGDPQDSQATPLVEGVRECSDGAAQCTVVALALAVVCFVSVCCCCGHISKGSTRSGMDR